MLRVGAGRRREELRLFAQPFVWNGQDHTHGFQLWVSHHFQFSYGLLVGFLLTAGFPFPRLMPPIVYDIALQHPKSSQDARKMITLRITNIQYDVTERRSKVWALLCPLTPLRLVLSMGLIGSRSNSPGQHNVSMPLQDTLTALTQGPEKMAR